MPSASAMPEPHTITSRKAIICETWTHRSSLSKSVAANSEYPTVEPLICFPRANNWLPSGLYIEEHMSTASASHVIVEPLDHCNKDFEEIFRDHYLLVFRTAYGVTGRA